MEEEIKKQERQEGLHLARKTNGKRRNTTNSKGERKPRIPRQNGKNENENRSVESGKIEKMPLRSNTRKTRTKNVNATKERITDKFDVRFKKSNLKIIPLGGLDEIGKNITVFEYEDEIVLVDCGLEFPEDSMLGVDLVIPDVTYLERNKEKIKGLVITHGHEDHIGSIPYILRKINMPIYATRLTVALIKNKLEEHKLLKSTKMIEVQQG